MADHFWLDLNLDIFLTVVDTDNIVDELWKDDHGAELCLDHGWADTSLTFNGFASSLQFVDEVDVLNIEAPVEVTTAVGWEEFDEILDPECSEIIKSLTSEGVFTLGKLGHEKADHVKPFWLQTLFDVKFTS